MNNSKIKIGLKNNLDKLLFVFATSYLMLVAGWFWKHQQQKVSSSSVNVDNSIPQSTSNQTQTLALQNEISSNNTKNFPPQNIPPHPLPIPIVSLPPTSVNSNTPTNTLTIPPLPNTNTNNSLPYPPPVSSLPISQPPQPTLSSSPSFASTSTITPPPIETKIPSPPKLTKVPTINTLITNTDNKNTIPNLNTDNNKVTDVLAIAKETPIETNYNYKLIGIVELGNSGSVALFNINNLTEKVLIGNEIGTTGWVLMGINGTQAIISHQNQSVYLRVGETF
ncbi:hypothetical protein [Geminocystis sp. GBBB08]|uniref:hypothetical protein n=1 Tax=Geminocystis sp. GBBB08 TaxID=2604140 RepID=UPI0027E2E348|nr:hypothetical protein [Geminocystis sp. GBBB08]MBL1210642.1 hypothetical protein [Geminocystis sp. GBBB08]